VQIQDRYLHFGLLKYHAIFCQNAGSIDRGFTTASRTGKNGECGLQLHVGVFSEKYAAVKEDDEMRIYWVKAKIEADCFGMV
jgi:hypothetical protein